MAHPQPAIPSSPLLLVLWSSTIILMMMAHAVRAAQAQVQAQRPVPSFPKHRHGLGQRNYPKTEQHLPSLSSSSLSCPCDDEQLCQPISGVPPIRNRDNNGGARNSSGGELYGFILKDSSSSSTSSPLLLLNWTYITTLAWANQDEIMCEAHRHGARAVWAAPDFNLTYMAHALYGPARRQRYAQTTLELVQSTHSDGVVFDYEEPIILDDDHDSMHLYSSSSSLAQAYVELVQTTAAVLKAYHPFYQVTVCAAWSPDGIDGRNYPYKALADVADALYVMDYDTRSQIFDDCIASANAPITGMKHGIERYLQLGIPPSKLILGVPWYGYRYTCLLNATTMADVATSRYCPIQLFDWRGSACSDAVGSEVEYQSLIQHILPKAIIRGRDDAMDAPYFNTLEEEQEEPEQDGNNSERTGKQVVCQYWYDDPISTRHKYAWAKAMNLAGVGPYRFDFVPVKGNGQDRQEMVQMWSALDAFFGANNTSVS